MSEVSPTTIKNEDKPEKKPKRKFCLFCGLFVLLVFILSFAGKLIYLSYYEEDEKSQTPVKTTEAKEEVKTKTKAPASKKTSEEVEVKQEEPTENQTATGNNSDNSMLEYFIDTATYNYRKIEFYVSRWTKSSVSVGVAEGTFSESLNNCLNSFVQDFNQESASVKLRRDDTVDTGIPNIKIYYWEDSKFKERVGQDSTYGVTEWIHKDDKSLQRSMIFFSHDLMNADEAVRCQVVRHEMMHAVGFWGHSDKVPAGIMSSPKTSYDYPNEDKRLIKMLYNSGIPIGTSAQAARDYFGSNSNW